MNRTKRIKNILEKYFCEIAIEVKDNSSLHKGHNYFDGTGETHISIYISKTSKFNGVIQLGPDYSTSINEIAKRIVSLSGKKIIIKFDKSKPEGDFDRMANNSRAKNYLNWSPFITLEEGLKKIYAWCEIELL